MSFDRERSPLGVWDAESACGLDWKRCQLAGHEGWSPGRLRIDQGQIGEAVEHGRENHLAF